MYLKHAQSCHFARSIKLNSNKLMEYMMWLHLENAEFSILLKKFPQIIPNTHYSGGRVA